MGCWQTAPVLRAISFFRRGIAFLLGALGIYWLPKDIADYNEAAPIWRKMLAMIDQNTALWALCLALIATLFWSEGKAYIRDRDARKAAADLETFKEGRSRFTIREAACLAIGVHPRDYDSSVEAQGQASEMLHYARLALIHPAEMTSEQHTMLRQGRTDHGFDLSAVSLDTVITREELDHGVHFRADAAGHTTPAFHAVP